MAEPINADFAGVDIDDSDMPDSAQFAVISFETAQGLQTFRIPIDGILQLMTALEDLPIERHSHYA